MLKDTFDQNELNSQLKHSPDPDFDAELLELLGEDLFAELAPSVPFPPKSLLLPQSRALP